MRRRHRRMYQLTGLPGWARSGHHGGGCCCGEHGPSHHESGHHGGGCCCGEHGPSHHESGHHGGGCCCGEHGPSHHESGHHGGGCCCGEHGPSHHGPMPREACHEPAWASPCGALPTAEEERDFLKAQADALRRYLGRIERRISELEPSEA